ncbi:MAG: glycosyltransferase family 4 protein [Caldilineaceae bacterium]|nr:glycosyltransferase family 4 protein [Caldilineaceae bacterium]
MAKQPKPALLILNQMAGPMTWELAEDLGNAFGSVALLTGHPDTLQKSHPNVQLFAAKAYERGSFVRRAITWLHYCWQAFWWIWRWPKETPLLLFSNPPILVWLGRVVQMLRGQKYAVMVHDIYPDVLVRTHVFPEHHLLMRLWRRLNRSAYEHASVVMTLGEFMAATLVKQFDVSKTPGCKIEVIPPWVDTDVIKPIPKAENWFAKQYNQVDKLTVMYSGNMGLGHDIETMIGAARQLHHRDDIHFMFIGAGPKWQLVNEVVTSEALPNVTLLGWQPEEVIPYSLAAADVALVSLEPEFEGIMVPSKASYNIAVGATLVLLASNNNEWSMWIQDYQCGDLSEPGNINSLVKTIIDLAKDRRKLKNCHNSSLCAASEFFSRRTCSNWISSLIKLSCA